jgi:hypothetical protein
MGLDFLGRVKGIAMVMVRREIAPGWERGKRGERGGEQLESETSCEGDRGGEQGRGWIEGEESRRDRRSGVRLVLRMCFPLGVSSGVARCGILRISANFPDQTRMARRDTLQ